MPKIVERIEPDRRSNGGKWIEFTPERVAQARKSLRRRLNDGGSLMTMTEAARAPGLLPPLPQPARTAEPEIESAVPGRSRWG